MAATLFGAVAVFRCSEVGTPNRADRFGKVSLRGLLANQLSSTTASVVELIAMWSEALIEPTGAHGLGTEVADALEKPAVGRDKDDAASGRCRLRHQSVVAVVGGVDDTHAVNICLSDAGAGGALEDYHRRQRDSPLPPGLTELLDELARRARPVPPPPVGLGPDDVGGVDHEHARHVGMSGR
jgi:hypothetical protein